MGKSKNEESTIELYNDLIFVRHAEAIIDETLPNNLLPLTELGALQAEKVSKLLENQYDIVISSISNRAVMTAKAILKGKEPIQDKRLLERGWGNEQQDGKETDEEAEIRITNFLKEIIEKYKNNRIVIVTHGSLIKIAQNVIENQKLERGRINNCTAIKYTKNKEKIVIKN